MKLLLLAAGIVLGAAAAAHADDPTAGKTDTAVVIENVVGARNSRVIYVLPYGQFYHRYDHILATGQLELKPEAAIERQYTRCPECLPPRSTEELNRELSTGGPKVSRYYTKYLSERAVPTITNVPPGADLPEAPRIPTQAVTVIPPAQSNITPQAPSGGARR